MSYPGGKGGCYRQIISRMPPHEVYVETHLGSGAVLMHKKQAQYSIAIDIDEQVVLKWRRLLGSQTWTNEKAIDPEKIEVFKGDAVGFLKSYDLHTETLVYCDPPYVMSTRSSKRRYYDYEYTDIDHASLLTAVRSLGCLVMISGYRSDLYDEALQDWRRADFTSSTRRGRAKESVWMNFPAGELHEYSHIGGNYRERERIKRKRARWARRFAKLPANERDAMLRDLLHYHSSESAMRAHIDVFGEPSRSDISCWYRQNE